MKIECYPVKFEAYDSETRETLFRVEADDECSASISFDVGVNVASWDEISASIRECLVAMRFEGDEGAE